MTAVLEPTDPARVDQVLDAVHRHTARLLDHGPSTPRRLRVQAGDVVVELEWPTVGEPAVHAAPAVTTSAVAAATVTAPAPVEAAPASDLVQVRAPMVGVFYQSPEPGAKPFVTEGDLVVPGQQVAIVEAMKLMVPVEAEYHGRVVEVLVANGDPVEYHQPLFTLAPLNPE